MLLIEFIWTNCIFICSLNFHFQTICLLLVLSFGILTLYGCIGIVPLNCNYISSERENSLHLFRSSIKICLMFPLQYNLLKNSMRSWTFQMFPPKHQLYLKWLQMMLKFPQSKKVPLPLSDTHTRTQFTFANC